jgi:hypothetical protein
MEFLLPNGAQGCRNFGVASLILCQGTSMNSTPLRSHPVRKIISLASCCLLLVAFCLGDSSGAKKKEATGFMVLPYLQLPTPTGMTVMWETKAKLRGRVEFGLTRALTKAAEHEQPAKLHQVRLTGLKPATTYYYRVKSGPLTSAVSTFKTAPPPGTKRWRMAVYGDSRSNPRMHRKVVEQVARSKVDLIVHTGDIVVNGKIYSTWRKEFFEPLAPLAGSVPWVSTIGNHERDAEHYFSYMALPGNKHYFSVEYANAQIICLDSNSWIAKGRDSKQFRWLQEHLRKKRTATWTFVAFHHPLFSAHASRPIHALRWDWAPVFLDPANRVDGVFTGHDHFYARNYRMGHVSAKPQAGVLFLTTAGGGAGLYRCKKRDYVARTLSVHHFTLFDFDGDTATISAIDIRGKVFDRHVLTKKATPAADYCAYEIEEFRKFLRLALKKQPPLRPGARTKASFKETLRVPTRFPIPLAGTLTWQEPPGWKMARRESKFRLQPRQALEIPLRATVRQEGFDRSPRLTIAFEKDKFRNRTIEVYPFKLAGPRLVKVARTNQPMAPTQKVGHKIWAAVPAHPLLPLASDQDRGKEKVDRVQFLADKDWLHVRVTLSDVAGRVKITPADPSVEGSRLTFFREHVQVVFQDGKRRRRFAVTPASVRFSTANGEEHTAKDWRAVVGRHAGGWLVQMAIPRKLLADLPKAKINVIHRSLVPAKKGPRRFVNFELCPAYQMGGDADRLPDWRAWPLGKEGAQLVISS